MCNLEKFGSKFLQLHLAKAVAIFVTGCNNSKWNKTFVSFLANAYFTDSFSINLLEFSIVLSPLLCI